MTIYKLKDLLDSQYNRSDVKRHQRSVLFLIQNTVTGNQSLYEIDRISKHTAALRCIEKKCRARLSIEHDIPTEPFGSSKGRVIASTVLKEDLLNMENWLKVYHSHTLKCKMIGQTIYDKNTYFDRNGQFRHFSYLQWDYFNDIISDDFNTTTNCSESINSAYNRHCKSGFRSANIIASNIFDFKYNMLAKRGLIRRYGETKMNKVKPKT